MTISLCMIVRDEEAVLGRCLDSIRDAVDEIVIVDTGSTDRTKEVAARYTDRIFDYPWISDFSAARNYAFSKGTCDYLLWLDADDVLPDTSRERLLSLKSTLGGNVDVVTFRYNIGFDELGTPVYSCVRERLFRRESRPVWHDPVHEYIPMTGVVYHAAIDVDHRKTDFSSRDRNLEIYEKALREGKSLSPRAQYYLAREYRDHDRHAEAAAMFETFLAGGEGWSEDCIAACHLKGLCYRHLGRADSAFLSFCESFAYDLPRAECCCELGTHFFERQEYEKAIFWYDQALSARRPTAIAFVQEDYWGYIPLLQLCVCHSRLNNNRLASEYNERAAAIKPYSSAVAANRQFFDSVRT